MDQLTTSAPATSEKLRQARFIPLRRADLLDALASHPDLPAGLIADIKALGRKLATLFHIEYFERREQLKDLYVAVNPDQPGSQPLTSETLSDLIGALTTVCDAANFTELTREQIEAAESEMGRVRAKVRVPWELYSDVRIFVRGQTSKAIRWKTVFGLREHIAEMQVYTQVLLVARVAQDADAKAMKKAPLRRGGLYLKLFRDIPKADLDTLIPNGRVLIGPIDKALIAVPALVGGIPILINVIPALSVLFLVAAAYLGFQGHVEDDALKKALAALSGLGALVGFLMRQWVKFERQALRYQKKVSDNAYFNNLNNNAAFFDFIIGTSEDSEVKEAMLAYVMLLVAGRPLSEQEVDARIEAYLLERFDLSIDFEIDDALAKLERLGIASPVNGLYAALPPVEALKRVHSAWLTLADAA